MLFRSVALDALKLVDYHELNLREAAGKIHQWAGRLLVPLYHPSPQVLITSRREAAQLRDYKVVARAIRQQSRLDAGLVPRTRRTSPPSKRMVKN